MLNNKSSTLSLKDKPKNKLFTLVMMQLRNKLDLTTKNNTKKILRNLLFSVLKFIIISAVVFLILYLS